MANQWMSNMSWKPNNVKGGKNNVIENEFISVHTLWIMHQTEKDEYERILKDWYKP